MIDRSLRHHLDEGRTYHVGPKGRGMRLDDFLCERIPRLPRERIHELIRTRVFLSWEAAAEPETIVKAGGDVHVALELIQETQIDPEIPVLYEDGELYAVDKPSGLLVHPTSYCRKNALTRILERSLGHRLYMVHRLDRDTSGVFLLTKVKEAAQRLTVDFRVGKIEKRYFAIVHGRVKEDFGRIEKPLAKTYYTPKGMRRDVIGDLGSGESAVTEFRVEKREGNYTCLYLFPKTGRTHQIRVHLASMGHPIVGDSLYGEEGKPKIRLLLHACALGLSHPMSGKRMRIVAPLPRGFVSLF